MQHNNTLLETWYLESADEESMDLDHLPYWKRMIEMAEISSLNDKTVLDFGCNRGGFLRVLYKLANFQEGIGTDLALDSLKLAKENSVGFPIKFTQTHRLENYRSKIDYAFSHEVCYLLEDLDFHAKEIDSLLKPGGTYFFSTGCHTENPLWPEWRRLVEEKAHIHAQDYSPADFLESFKALGYTTKIEAFNLTRPANDYKSDDWFPALEDWNTFYREHKLFFTATKANV